WEQGRAGSTPQCKLGWKHLRLEAVGSRLGSAGKSKRKLRSIHYILPVLTGAQEDNHVRNYTAIQDRSRFGGRANPGDPERLCPNNQQSARFQGVLLGECWRWGDVFCQCL